MATVDTLEIKIQSTINEVNKSLDNTVSKLGLVTKGLSAIKNNKGLEEFAKQAESITSSMQSVQAKTKEMVKSIDEPVKKVSKSLEQISEQYKDIGKDFQFFGNIQSTQKKIESLSNTLETAKLKKQELEAAGKTEGKAYENAVKDVIKYTNQIESLKKQITNVEKAEKSVDIKINFGDAEKDIQYFKDQLKEFDSIIESGGAETESGITFPVRGLEISLEQLREMFPEAKELISSYESEIERAQSLSEYVPRMKYGTIDLSAFEKIQDKANESSDKIKEFGERLNRLEVPEIREGNLDKLRNSLTKAEAKLDELRTKLQNGLTVGRITESVDNAGYRNLQEQIALTEKTAEALRAKISEVEKTSGNTGGFEILKNAMSKIESAGKRISQSFSKVISVLKKFGSTVKSIASSIGKAVKSILLLGNSTKKTNKSFSGGLKTILKYGLGIRSLYILFNKLRNAIKDGMENLVQYSDRTNQSVSMLNSSLSQLKNSSAAAISPILNAIAPALNSLIQLFIKATNAVNQFFAALTGQSTWIKAKYVYEDVADSVSSAGKAAKGALQPFDALNNLTTQETSGAGAISAEDMFETVPLEDKFKEFTDKLKKMLEDADFTDLGSTLGDKLKDALDNISWSGIKEKASKIAKSIATLINGFIETENLGYSIGNTLAQGINSAYTFLNSFVHNLHWGSVGEFIGNALNGFFENIDWDLIYDTFVTGFHGLAESINSFVRTFDWDNLSDSVGSIVIIISDSLTEFFKTVEWEELGRKIGKQIELLLKNDKIWYSVGSAIGSGLQAAFNFVKGMVSEIRLEDVVSAIKNVLKGLFKNFDNKGEIAVIILGVIAAKLALKATASFFNGSATTIGNAISLSLTKYALPVIGSAVAGWKLGNMVGRQLFGDEAYDDFSWIDFFGSLNAEDFIGAMEEMSLSGSEAAKTILDAFRHIGPTLMSMTDDTKSWFDKIAESILQQNDNVVGSCAIAGATIIENFDNIDSSQQKLSQKTDEVTEEINRYWNGATSSMSSIISGATRGIETSFSSTYKSVIASTESFVRDLKRKLKSVSGAASGAVLGGAVAVLGKTSISQYASGGYPNSADLFWANENGIPELVGTMNGKTAVASGTEITGIADAVYNTGQTEASLLQTAVGLLQIIASKEYGITEGQIFESVKKSATEYTKRTGSYPFA